MTGYKKGIKGAGYCWGGIEDLAFPGRSSRESGEAGYQVCLSLASYAGAEKDGEEMA